ncbi:hypothetical protein L289_3720 [Acinetobacter gerneri DSM 14967 = CIP 107464 = MTCC 9824]|nr:hypothetical protein L289_3720 [Acinetobacter gerneri DSM 14967 = CIP 107464 = MTCC 9824]
MNRSSKWHEVGVLNFIHQLRNEALNCYKKFDSLKMLDV